MSKDFVDLLAFFRTHFTGSMREDVRDTAATLYGIVQAHSANKAALDADALELLGQARTNKSLEAQCGLMAAACSLLERSITLWKTKALQTLGGPDFNVKEWKPYVDCITYLGMSLLSLQLWKILNLSEKSFHKSFFRSLTRETFFFSYEKKKSICRYLLALTNHFTTVEYYIHTYL